MPLFISLVCSYIPSVVLTRGPPSPPLACGQEYSVDGAGGSSGLSGGAIAGIVIGVIVGVVLLVGIFCYCKRSMAQTAMKG